MIKTKMKTHWRYRDFKYGIVEERLDEDFEISRFEEAFLIDYTDETEFDRLEEVER